MLGEEPNHQRGDNMSTVRADQAFGTPAAATPVRPTTTTGRKRWTTVGVLSTLQAIENSEGGLINSLFPVIRADWPASS
jgi:hypothetical protein